MEGLCKTPQDTKHFNRKGISEYSLNKSGSTVQRLNEHHDLNWANETTEKIKQLLVDQGERPHYLSQHGKGEKRNLFFGTDEGQRIHFQAERLIKEKGDNWDANDLLSYVCAPMESTEKKKVIGVSNYWLAGDSCNWLGIVGERIYRLSTPEERSSSKFKKTLHEYLESLAEGNENPIVDIGRELGDGAKSLFLENFRQAEKELKKDWKEDINRSSYSHKPGLKIDAQSYITKIYEDLICRRMCKWMLHLACFNNQPVVYALDTVELLAVAEGKIMRISDSVNESSEITLKMPVCTSELREIFRYLDTLGSHVMFYESLLPASPPWGADQEEEVLKSWAEYAIHLTRKILLTHVGDNLCIQQAKQMLQAWKDKRWSEIIHCYRELKPSQLLAQVVPLTKQQIEASTERRKKLESSEELMNPEKMQDYYNLVTKMTNLIYERALCLIDENPFDLLAFDPTQSVQIAMRLTADDELQLFFPHNRRMICLSEGPLQFSILEFTKINPEDIKRNTIMINLEIDSLLRFLDQSPIFITQDLKEFLPAQLRINCPAPEENAGSLQEKSIIHLGIKK